MIKPKRKPVDKPRCCKCQRQAKWIAPALLFCDDHAHNRPWLVPFRNLRITKEMEGWRL